MPKGLITLKNLTLKYEKNTVIENVNLQVAEGDFICVVGENGTGKTTLIKSLVGLKNLDSGEIVYDSINKSDISYIAQQNNIKRHFPASVLEVVMQGLESAKTLSPFYKKEEKALALKTLRKLGIENIANKPISELSGGQQRRVLLSRALISSKKLLIMDEPVASLDTAAAKEIYNIAKKLCEDEKMAVVVVLHDLGNAIKYATKILWIKDDSHKLLTPQEYLKEAEL